MIESNIYPKPEFLKKFPLKKLPIADERVSFAFYPNIYLAPEVYENLFSENPTDYTLAILKHEQTHIQRQKAKGRLRWLFRYILSSNFRFSEELEAVKVEFGFMKKKGWEYDIEKLAKDYSGETYTLPFSKATSFNFVKNKLKKAWDEA